MRDELARVLDEADNRWQRGIGSGGYDLDGDGYFLMLADAVLTKFSVSDPEATMHGGGSKPMPDAPDEHGGELVMQKRGRWWSRFRNAPHERFYWNGDD